MTRVLAILEAGDRYPSGVVRALVYRDLFARDGFDVEFVSRQPLAAADAITRRPWLPFKHKLLEAATLWSEQQIIERSARFDVIYLSKVIAPKFLRRLRRRAVGRIVLDFGDAVWLDEYGHGAEARFVETLGLVDAVTTDNDRTADYVRRFDKPCTVVPDSPQLEAFDRRRTAQPSTTSDVVVGWIGSASTLYNLELISDALHEVARRRPEMRLRLVGAGSDSKPIQRFERLRLSVQPSYSQAEMIDEVLRMDVGLFPLQDIEQSRVRGVLKATIYMAGETAVIASPVGQIPEVIHDGANGMLAASPGEWIDKLDALVADSALRRRLAAGGLETVRTRFRTDQSWQISEVSQP
jgi:glycosyltransferase involved in cell wall biosynthesis